LTVSAGMIDSSKLIKTDATRRIDRIIDYFGERRPSAIRRRIWLTRRDPKPALPAIFLQHPLALDPGRRGA
jgi:hypothetical protein